MSRSIEEIEAEIASLSRAERDILLRDLIAGLDEFEEEDVEEAWIQEIQRRYREWQEGSVETVPVEDVIAQARSRLKR